MRKTYEQQEENPYDSR